MKRSSQPFVKTGKPTCPGAPEWPPYTRESDQLMELNLRPQVLKGYRADQLDAQEANLSHYQEKVQASYEKLLTEGI